MVYLHTSTYTIARAPSQKTIPGGPRAVGFFLLLSSNQVNFNHFIEARPRPTQPRAHNEWRKAHSETARARSTLRSKCYVSNKNKQKRTKNTQKKKKKNENRQPVLHSLDSHSGLGSALPVSVEVHGDLELIQHVPGIALRTCQKTHQARENTRSQGRWSESFTPIKPTRSVVSVEAKLRQIPRL